METQSQSTKKNKEFKLDNNSKLALAGLGGVAVGAYLLHDPLDRLGLIPSENVNTAPLGSLIPNWIKLEHTDNLDGGFVHFLSVDQSNQQPLSYEQMIALVKLDEYKGEKDRYNLFSEFNENKPLNFNLYTLNPIEIPKELGGDKIMHVAGFWLGGEDSINVANTYKTIWDSIEPVSTDQLFEVAIHETVHEKQNIPLWEYLFDQTDYKFDEMAANLAVKNTVDSNEDGVFDYKDTHGVWSSYDQYIEQLHYHLVKNGYNISLSEFADLAVPASIAPGRSVDNLMSELSKLYPSNPNNNELKSIIETAINGDYNTFRANHYDEWVAMTEANPGHIA